MTKDKQLVVDFLEMVQRDIGTTTQTVPVYAEAKLKKDFDIRAIISSENELKTGNETHKKIIVKLMQLLCQFTNPLSSELAYSTLSLLMCMVSLDGTISTFIEVLLINFFY